MELDNKCKKVQKLSNDPCVTRGTFVKCLKFYRKTRKQIMRSFEKYLALTLDNMFNNNPKEYWSLVEKLKMIKIMPKSSPV